MKLQRLVIKVLSVGLLVAAASAWAFMGMGGPKTDTNEQLGLLFGKNRAFTGTAEMTVKGKHEGMGMEMDYAVRDGKLRVQMDMAKAKTGSNVGSAGMEQMAAMGLNIMVTLVRPDKKTTYVIYPGLNGYCEFAQTISAGSAPDAKPPKIERTEIGKETVDGHPCAKCKIVITTDENKKYEMLAWQASDLQDFPIKSEMQSGADTVVTLFKNVKFDKPPAGLFEVPPGLKKHGTVQELMMSGMQDMLKNLGR